MGTTGEVAVGEFEDALRAQIAAARAQLDRALDTKDLEEITFVGLRLRYLLEIAEDSGVEVDQAHGPGPGGAVEDAEG